MNPSYSSDYLTREEQLALDQTESWLNEEVTKFKKFMGLTRKPIEYAYSKVPESLRESIASAILSVLTSVRDGTMSLVSTESVSERLAQSQIDLEGDLAIYRMPLGALESTALYFMGQSKKACTLEGAATGAVGLPGIVVDIPALYGLLFRMISQVAASFGYSMEQESERDFALKILDVGHLLDPEAKRQGMEELSGFEKLNTDPKAVEDLQRVAVEKSLQTMARHLGVALTQRKLAQSVALVGSVVGASVNRQLATEVGEVAFHAYRRRHLAELVLLRRSDQIPFVPTQTRTCSRCKTVLELADRFCPCCGLALAGLDEKNEKTQSTSKSAALLEVNYQHQGQVTVEIEAETLNLLLQELSKPDFPVRYRQGQWVVEQDSFQAALSVPLTGAKGQWSGQLGKIQGTVTQLDCQQDRLILDLEVGWADA